MSILLLTKNHIENKDNDLELRLCIKNEENMQKSDKQVNLGRTRRL